MLALEVRKRKLSGLEVVNLKVSDMPFGRRKLTLIQHSAFSRFVWVAYPDSWGTGRIYQLSSLS